MTRNEILETMMDILNAALALARDLSVTFEGAPIEVIGIHGIILGNLACMSPFKDRSYEESLQVIEEYTRTAKRRKFFNYFLESYYADLRLTHLTSFKRKDDPSSRDPAVHFVKTSWYESVGGDPGKDQHMLADVGLYQRLS